MREATKVPSCDHQTQMKQRQFIMEKKKMTLDWAVNSEEATLGGKGNWSPMAMEQIWQEEDEHGRAEMERRSRSAKGTVDVAYNDSSNNNSNNKNTSSLAFKFGPQIEMEKQVSQNHFLIDMKPDSESPRVN
jgi:pyruvate-formate lyase